MILTRFLLLPLVLVAPGAHAQDAAPPSTETANVEREARRVLHLANGQSIRVVARKAGERWEYKNKGGWKTLEPAQVVRVALESELLREWKAKSAVETQDARVAAAEWAAREGLVLEGLEALDRVLEAEPDHAGALAVLAAHEWMNVPSLDVPTTELAHAKDTLLRFGASLPTAGRELAVQELARIEDREGLRTDLERELRSTIVARRSFATLALRRLCRGEAVKPLLMHAVLDPSEDVRRGASHALRAAGEPGLIVPVIKALDSRSSAVRSNAAEALGEMGYAAAVEPLIARMAANLQGGSARPAHSYIFQGRQIAYVQDFDVEVAQFQAVADPNVNTLVEGSVLDVAVLGTQEVAVVVEQATIRRSLERLTNASPGKSAKAWAEWWAANGERWRSVDHSAPSPKPSPKLSTGQG